MTLGIPVVLFPSLSSFITLLPVFGSSTMKFSTALAAASSFIGFASVGLAQQGVQHNSFSLSCPLTVDMVHITSDILVYSTQHGGYHL
jgi:hypothetical protein